MRVPGLPQGVMICPALRITGAWTAPPAHPGRSLRAAQAELDELAGE
ncbi:MAG TPA: hypothetical protein VK016_00010 [Arenimonas sp.]|nr:hypothetical protein [Arenimonas sp.]